ncbi:MAG: LysM peptidoglycan-binding domain-containing protein [Clostridia bacterium]|nr:LysM peptidoglycan-binding domain-containing protein [Clostridia bacterium]
MTIYTVQTGDTPTSVAASFGIPLSRLLSDNGLTPEQILVVGQQLVILPVEEAYTVQNGDSLYSISQTTGLSINELLRNNPALRGVPQIYPGQTLALSLDAEQGRMAAVNGYLYPFIDESVLRAVLPYLSYVTVFTYGFREDGSLIPEKDETILDITKGYGVGALLLISTLTDEGVFNNRLSSVLFQNQAAQDALIENLLKTVREKGYRGVEVDFEYISAEDAAGYVAFLSRLKEALAAEGYLLFVALAPKIADDQPGLLYEGHDYGGIGAVADYVILMTYEWGYKFGPPGAVAPLSNVEDVIRYAIGRISPEKILLGIPNYGYDWPLPFVQGETEAQGIGNVAAVELAGEQGVDIQYDREAQAPYYYYTDDGIQHVVWFESAESVERKLRLVERYGLAGISIWNIMRYFPQLYRVLNATFRIGQ